MDIVTGYHPGCIGRVTELHASYYARLVDFGAPFEAKVATEMSDFCLRYDAARDGLWLAVQDGVIHGSIAIDGSHAAESGAHLRWFITSDAARGHGLGARLLDGAMDFCRRQSYTKVYLWTFEGLPAARHLYEKHGFTLTRSQRGTQWGKEVTEQLFTFGSV